MEIDGGGSQGREISTYSGAQSLKLLITATYILPGQANAFRLQQVFNSNLLRWASSDAHKDLTRLKSLPM